MPDEEKSGCHFFYELLGQPFWNSSWPLNFYSFLSYIRLYMQQRHDLGVYIYIFQVKDFEYSICFLLKFNLDLIQGINVLHNFDLVYNSICFSFKFIFHVFIQYFMEDDIKIEFLNVLQPQLRVSRVNTIILRVYTLSLMVNTLSKLLNTRYQS